MVEVHNRLIFYDQGTLGRSTGEACPQYINIQTYVADIEAIRQALGKEKITLLGHSWGGFLAMQYAIAYPGNVAKLILVSSMGPSAEDFSLFVAELGKRLAPYQGQLEAIADSPQYRAGEPEAVNRWLQVVFQTYLYRPELIDDLNFYQSQHSALNGFVVNKIFYDELFSKPFDLSSALQHLPFPTLIIHGDSDPIPLSSAKHLCASIPKAELAVLDKCGHFPFVEKADRFFTTIEAFLHPKPMPVAISMISQERPHLYFAYGSNLSYDFLKKRLKEGEWVDEWHKSGKIQPPIPIDWGNYELCDYEFSYSLLPCGEKQAAGNISPKAGTKVYGVLYSR